MLQNALLDFSDIIYLSLLKKSECIKGLLVKKHHENLQTHGDFSFPNSAISWHEFLNWDQINDKSEDFLEIVGKKVEDIVEESKKWILSVSKVKKENARVYLFLERAGAIRVGLLESFQNNTFILQRIREGASVVDIDPLIQDKRDLSSLRAKYFFNVVKNLCAIFKVDSPVFVTSKSSSESAERRLLLSGTVLNAKSGTKETDINADDFIRIRQDEMTLIAQHKYGVRVSTDSKWKEYIAHLGESAVVFELLQTKPSSPVKINLECSSVGSSKGASFILYNCARLETIIRTYNERVSEGTYPQLPDFENTDFTLLTQEDEWCLVFNFILGLPSLLTNCVEINERSCEFRPHHLCSFLNSMVRVISQYYRRVRILTEPRKHLLPVMFARIHMLTALNDTLKICLKLLNIKSVSQMCISIFYCLVI